MASTQTQHNEKAWAQPFQSANVEDETTSLSTEDDLAAAIVPEHAQQLDPHIERRVLRKIDLYLIPFMWIGYGFVYYDKVGHIWGFLSRNIATDLGRRSSVVPSFSE